MLQNFILAQLLLSKSNYSTKQMKSFIFIKLNKII